MRVLGIDPGPKASGWCSLDGARGYRPKWVGGGSVPSTQEAQRDLLAREAPDLVVVEEPEFIPDPDLIVAYRDLLPTARVAGEWRALAWERGVREELIFASAWRLRVTGERGPEDAKVASCVRRLVSGVPVRCTVHARDAAGAAWSGFYLEPNYQAQRAFEAELHERKSVLKAQATRQRNALLARVNGGRS